MFPRFAISRLMIGARMCAVFALGMMSFPHLHAQDPTAEHPARFDPSDVYFQGYLASRAAERLEIEEDYMGAWQKYQEADRLFSAVQKFYPEWRASMVEGRANRTREAMAAARPKAEEQQDASRRVVAELEGGQRVGGEDLGEKFETPSVLEVDPIASRKLKAAETEVDRLRQLLADGAANDNEAARNASRVNDLQRQRDDLQARLRSAETDVAALRARLATSPAESQLGELNRRIDALEQERAAMGLALNQSRRTHTEAQAKIATLEADLEVLRQQADALRQGEADLKRDIARERQVANDVVAGMRRQMQEMASRLNEKDQELAKANQTIASLTRELSESRDAYADLRDERDALLRERDQLATLLHMNEGSRINELIEQNMGLVRQLREANERVDLLGRDGNATKDDLTIAIRDLAVAKAQINRLQQEKRAQDQRLDELQDRLRDEERGLALGLGADPAESEILREIIRRQLLTQERRRQASQALLEAARALGKQDEQLAEAIEIFEGEEIQLSPEEQKLIANQHVDGEFISPFARDRDAVARNMDGLNLELESYDRAATRAFAAGRYLPSRELYLQMVELHPGHTPALCKLGVLHLKLEDPAAAADAFQRAVELDGTNAYAHRMLAFSLMHSGEISAAQSSAARSVEIAPHDPLAQLLMGTVSFRLGQFSQAETHFKAAINADPMLSEPYFNLAVLHSRTARMKDAREYYGLALERGAVPDPTLEKNLYQ